MIQDIINFWFSEIMVVVGDFSIFRGVERGFYVSIIAVLKLTVMMFPFVFVFFRKITKMKAHNLTEFYGEFILSVFMSIIYSSLTIFIGFFLGNIYAVVEMLIYPNIDIKSAFPILCTWLYILSCFSDDIKLIKQLKLFMSKNYPAFALKVSFFGSFIYVISYGVVIYGSIVITITMNALSTVPLVATFATWRKIYKAFKKKI